MLSLSIDTQKHNSVNSNSINLGIKVSYDKKVICSEYLLSWGIEKQL